MLTKTPQSVPDLFRLERQDWLMQARVKAEALCQTHEAITIRDVLAVHPLPSYLGGKRKAILGHVFNNQVFRKVGIERSRSTGAKGHYINKWSLREEYYAPEELTYKRFRGKEFDDGD